MVHVMPHVCPETVASVGHPVCRITIAKKPPKRVDGCRHDVFLEYKALGKRVDFGKLNSFWSSYNINKSTNMSRYIQYIIARKTKDPTKRKESIRFNAKLSTGHSSASCVTVELTPSIS
jgi:hypothetical protein